MFDSAQNQAFLALCARKTIRNAAIAGVIWGAINLAVGYFAVLTNPLNAGILALGLLMLGSGLAALRKPSLGALLTEAVVSLLLFCWNLGVTIMNVRAGHADHINAHGLIFPAIVAAIFFTQYRQLGHLRDTIASMDPAMIKEASSLCRQLFKSSLKQSPDIVQASSKRWRLRFMGDSVLCVQRNLTRAFSLRRTDFQQCILHPEKPRLRVMVRHPLGKISYGFDRKNSDKIKAWLETPSATAT